MIEQVTVESMKADAAAYIAEQIQRCGKGQLPDDQAAAILAPILNPGPTRDLVILFMCGFAARMIEEALKDD